MRRSRKLIFFNIWLMLAALATGASVHMLGCIGDLPTVAQRTPDADLNALDGSDRDGSFIDGSTIPLPAHCTNNQKDPGGVESDTDCGGECAPCSNGKACNAPLDCASGGCTNGKCGAWARIVGSTGGEDAANGCRFNDAGELIVVGTFSGGTDFGKGAISPSGVSDAFVAKYTRAGELVWLKTFGGGGATEGYGLAVASNGDIAVSGRYNTSFGVDNISLPNNKGGWDGFVILLEPSTGKAKLVKGIGGTDDEVIGGIAFDANGDLFVGGSFTGPNLPIDAFTLRNAESGSSDFFVAKVARSNLGAIWALSFGSKGDAGAVDYLGGIAAAGNDVVISSQSFGGVGISLGGQFFPNSEYWDLGIGRLSGVDGGHQWSRHISAGFNDLASDVVVDQTTGNIFFAGSIDGNGDFGTGGIGPLPKPFLVTYAPDGGAIRTRVGRPPLDSTAPNYGSGATVDSQGNAVLTGVFNAPSLDLGESVFDPPDSGAPDPFIVAYDRNGKTTFAKAFFTEGTDPYSTYHPTIDPKTGNVVICGQTANKHDFGSGLLPTRGAHDIFIASLGRLH